MWDKYIEKVLGMISTTPWYYNYNYNYLPVLAGTHGQNLQRERVLGLNGYPRVK